MFFFCSVFFSSIFKKGGGRQKKTGTRAARIMQILKELAYYSFCTTANQPPTNAWHRKVIREPMCIFKTFARQCAALSAPSIFLVRGARCTWNLLRTTRARRLPPIVAPSGGLRNVAIKGRPFSK